MTIGERIKFYREKRGFSQSELAKIAGIPLGTFQKYEIDYRNPKKETLEKIAFALNVSPNTFLDVKSETIGDIAALFFNLAHETKISFHGTKDSAGKYDINTLTFSLESPFIKSYLRDWADAIDAINALRAQAELCPDASLRQTMLEHASLVEREAEYNQISSQILIPKDEKKEP